MWLHQPQQTSKNRSLCCNKMKLLLTTSYIFAPVSILFLAFVKSCVHDQESALTATAVCARWGRPQYVCKATEDLCTFWQTPSLTCKMLQNVWKANFSCCCCLAGTPSLALPPTPTISPTKKACSMGISSIWKNCRCLRPMTGMNKWCTSLKTPWSTPISHSPLPRRCPHLRGWTFRSLTPGCTTSPLFLENRLVGKQEFVRIVFHSSSTAQGSGGSFKDRTL